MRTRFLNRNMTGEPMSAGVDAEVAGGEVLQLAQALIGRPSVTPEDGGCQDLLTARLKAQGFAVTRLDAGGVRNFHAVRGEGEPCFAFAGHTDVVPPGDLGDWRTPPFEPTVEDGCLYGRGAADMKGGLAAMIVAAERFLAKHPEPCGRLAFLVTSDEEGEAEFGTKHIVAQLGGRAPQTGGAEGRTTTGRRGDEQHWAGGGRAPDYCIIGEPSSSGQLGDVARNGRRGSLNGSLRVRGVQGHVAYPHLARNPIHLAAPFLKDLTALALDQGNAHYPPSSLQVSNISAGAGASNVIPGELRLDFNIRYSTEQTAAGLQKRIADLLDGHGLEGTLRWRLSGAPFLTPPGRLTEAVQQAVVEELDVRCRLSTSGGTSDGRFLAPLGCDVVELGPVNASIHKANECVAVVDLERLAKVYERVLELLLT